MPVSVFDIFKIGIGSSSSHTVGPMTAARRFAVSLADKQLLPAVQRLQVDLFGSLALTGQGHGTDRAIILGLLGESPDTVDPDAMPLMLEQVRASASLSILGRQAIAFAEKSDLVLHRREELPRHPNGLRITAFGADGQPVDRETYYSVGGGFVVTESEFDRSADVSEELPFPYHSATELLDIGRNRQMSIAAIARANEEARRSPAEVDAGLMRIWQAMQDCVQRGLSIDGALPGGLGLQRRARQHLLALEAGKQERHAGLLNPLAALEWVNAVAFAVAEENAAGGRVVTAPTNGAAGVIPAVIHYLARFASETGQTEIFNFLLVAGAIGSLYKENASISGAAVGCQGEIGVACSMAAGGLAAALGGSNAQLENAAEIGMEHHLGLTCDPIGGLVQVPCIERNAIAATTAITACLIALRGDGRHLVSLDKVIATMRQTGADMQAKYKETSLGGLAVNLVEC